MSVIQEHGAAFWLGRESEPAWLASLLKEHGELVLPEEFDGETPTPAELAEVAGWEIACRRTEPERLARPSGVSAADLATPSSTTTGAGAGGLHVDVREWQQRLAGVDVDVTGTVPGLAQAEYQDLLRELEDLKATAAAAQAVLTAGLDRARRDAEEVRGVPTARRGKGLGAEIALARRVSPHQGGRHLGLAATLVADMPHTLTAMRTGRLSEWRATLPVRESVCLDRDQRTALDETICADPTVIDTWGDRRLVAQARRRVYEMSPEAVVARARRAESERRVTIRPAPDTMAYLTALLPAAQAIAAYGALVRAADTARATGEARGRGQVMADTLTARLTGQQVADAVPVAVQLVMTDRALLAESDRPADLPGYGTVPAAWARDLIDRTLDHRAPGGHATGTWLRRLFTHPDSDQLIAMDSRSRIVPRALAQFIALRDGSLCRTPWCDAPIRHTDHVHPAARGGPTTASNLQGTCERCNYVKALPGWEAQITTILEPPGQRPPGGPPTYRSAVRPRTSTAPAVTTTTPTGRRHTSRPPPVTG